jgi:hypothetical protein
LARIGCGLGLAACVVAGPRVGLAESKPLVSEYQVKAAYLFNFAKFVEWPASSFATPESPMVIGVYGRDPFGALLDTLVHDKKIGGRPLLVRRASSMPELRSSHLLFVGASSESLSTALAQLADAPALTIGEHERFIESGGMIRFDAADGRVVFTIDVGAAGRARLSISSQLLKLARVTGQSRP